MRKQVNISAGVNNPEKQAEIAQAKKELPSFPLQGGNGSQQTLEQWEVVVAYNLDPPYRYSQEFFWLEVLAESPREAAAITAKWTMTNAQKFEATDLVRKSSPHEKTIGVDNEGHPLPVFWNIPIDETLPDHTMIRDSISGIRIGFIATDKQEARWLKESVRGQYRLLMNKPGGRSEQPLGVAPLVKNLNPSQ